VTAPGREPIFKTMTVTPEMARTWLTWNTHNRTISQRAVDRLAASIRRGDWRMNGDAIRFSRRSDDGGDPMLLDGQHRLWAIVEAGEPVRTLVAWNLPHEVQETIDIGHARTVGQMLSLRGYTNGNILASAALLLWRYESGRWEDNQRPTHAELIEVVEKHPPLQASATVGARVAQALRMSGGAAAVGHLLSAEIDHDLADTFAGRLTDGVGLYAGSPILVFRNKALARDRRTRLRPDEWLAFYIKTWNAFHRGRRLHQLKHQPGDQFPRVV
jgi:hypothetical protein